MIYAIIPVFNRKQLTERFLHCLRHQTFTDFKVIVVDDGSTDGTAEMITDKFQDVQLLRGDGNLWWTGAMNVGIRHALHQASEADAILVINDDLEIGPDYVASLDRVRQAVPRALVGSVIVDIKDPDLIYDGGRMVNWWTAKFQILNAQRRISAFPRDHRVDVSLLTGWGTLIPLSVFRQIGLYDDKHFQQCGDTEFTVRAKNAGYRLVVSYAAVGKVHVEASDRMNVTEWYAMKDLRDYFFGIKSNFRLKYRLFFGLNTARNPFAFASFLLFDIFRISCHFLLRLRLQRHVSNATNNGY
jgi:GT2 family glycosyltransferase